MMAKTMIKARFFLLLPEARLGDWGLRIEKPHFRSFLQYVNSIGQTDFSVVVFVKTNYRVHACIHANCDLQSRNCPGQAGIL